MKSVSLGYGAFALEPNGSQSDDIWHFNEATLRSNGVGEADIVRYRNLVGGLLADDPRPVSPDAAAKPSPSTD